MRAPKGHTRDTRLLRLIEVGNGVLFPGQDVLLSGFDALSDDELASARSGDLVIGVVSRTRSKAGRAGAWSAVGTEAKVMRLVRFPNGETGARVSGLGLIELRGKPRRAQGGYVASVLSTNNAMRVVTP